MQTRFLRTAGRILAAAVLLALTTTPILAEEPAKKPEVKQRYRMPSIVMLAHVDWPKDAQYHDAMAEFVVSNGFNAVEGGMGFLDVCRKHGLMVQLGSDAETLKAAPKLKDDPAVFAYFVSDRRKRAAFPAFAATARAFEQADPNHPTIFINRANWNEFEVFTKEVKPLLLDFYHYHAMRGRHPERYYLYLLMFRGLAQDNGVPVMRCVSSSSPPGVLRQTIYTSLAYGVKGFHFWVPWIFAHEKDEAGNAKLKDGKLSTYVTLPHLAEIAKEVRLMSPVLTDCRSVAMYHTEPLPIQGYKAPEDAWVQPSGAQLLVGVFESEKDGDVLLVTNKHAGEKQTATLFFDESVESVQKMDKKTGKWAGLVLAGEGDKQVAKFDLPPGDGELLKVARKQ